MIGDAGALAEELWARMVALYGAVPGLAPLCLRLQDEHDVDVPLALTFGLLDARGQSPSPAVAEQMQAVAKEWQSQVISPLRAVRRWQKPRLKNAGEAALRERVKAIELEAERCQLLRLCDALGLSEVEYDPSRRALAPYLESHGVCQADRDALADALAG